MVPSDPGFDCIPHASGRAPDPPYVGERTQEKRECPVFLGGELHNHNVVFPEPQMNTTPSVTAMADLPDDLSDVGTHRGNDPEPETGQTVRSPTGPDPNATEVQPSPALFQVVRRPSENRLTIQAHSAQAEVAAPDEGEEAGRYRTVTALREALADEELDAYVAVFEDAKANRVIVDNDVGADHAWIGQPRYPKITFFEDPEAARTFADAHDRPTPES